MKDSIVFLGDSYTWGEGLELFIEKEKWINQRKYVTTDVEINRISDDESIEFRKTHRFPRIVGNYFDCEEVVDKHNGGSFSTYFNTLNQYELEFGSNNIKAIIVQLSHFYRTPIHLTYECMCSFCRKRPDEPIQSLIEDITQKDLMSSNVGMILQSFKKDKIDNEFLEWFWVWVDWIERFCYDLLEFKLKNYEDMNIPVFFIDTWDTHDIYVQTRKYITDRLIPLIGGDGKLYTRWVDFQKSFDSNFDINNYFPNTNNHHPSLLTHQHIAKSIIKKLETVL